MKVNKWIVYRNILDEYLLLDLRTQSRKYYKYSGTMAKLFTLFCEKDSVDEVVDELHKIYNETPISTIRTDVDNTLSRLIADGIISV